ncbi:gonidia-specific protein [Micractinium conductrix]|uniref:Gonidia-specific protein n=1 Tax=Micractinium conductrix TaxID=554055 RepID=A0A2P6V772_9CHLO|nr:gonidia-specific protein [Micractinium conductrix]|eukprot:PSC69936.1 gonidia-specific protein [Micractinium conductrix]
MATVAARACTVAAQGQRPQALQPARSGAAFRAVAALRPAARQQLRAVTVRAMVPVWTDPEFTAETLAAFPDQMIATVEEARCLIEKGGYTYLDVRPTLELDEAGRYKQCVNIPLVHSKWWYNPASQKREVKKEDNELFIQQIEKRFPNKDALLLVGCSDGRTYSMEALEMLDEAGYTNLVGLKGGFYSWFRVFDNKGNRRRGDGYTETYTHDGDSCGIHSSGAGFERMDKIENWAPPKF